MTKAKSGSKNQQYGQNVSATIEDELEPAYAVEWRLQVLHVRRSLYRLGLASKQLKAGEASAALLTIRESLKANHSDRVLLELLEMMEG